MDVDQADTISIDNDAARDAAAITKLLRSGQTELALFLIQSNGRDVEQLHALIGAFAAFANGILSFYDSIVDQHSAEVTLPSSTVILDTMIRNVANWGEEN